LMKRIEWNEKNLNLWITLVSISFHWILLSLINSLSFCVCVSVCICI
jgi:hypothetical protein